jgi:hypothetical protein
VKLGTIMSEVAVDIGGQEIVAAITRGSTERLGLQEGRGSDRDREGHRGDDRHRFVGSAVADESHPGVLVTVEGRNEKDLVYL